LLTNFIGFVKRVSENPSCKYGFFGTSFSIDASKYLFEAIFAIDSIGEQIQTRCWGGLGNAVRAGEHIGSKGEAQ
jgi:hypothetical protein